MIEQERIEHIKTTVDLKALVESKGISLKKNGKGWFGLCPFHHDKTPSLSVTPSKNEWHCFGCDKGGDVIRFVELFDQVDFKEAVNRLGGFTVQGSGVGGQGEIEVQGSRYKGQGRTAKHIRLFNRVIEFYHTAFNEDLRAKDYLNKRGITDKALFADYKTGFANGSLLNVLSEEVKEQLKEIGVLNTRGREHFYGCVTFPVYDLDGNPSGIYGRRVEGISQGADHLYLPGERRGVFNWQAVKSHKEIILTESIIDALTLINAGIKNVIPCYGVNGLTEDHLTLLKQYETKTVYICFDPDDPGINAAKEISQTLQALGIQTHTVNLHEEHDINVFFLLTANPADKFKELLNKTDPGSCQSVKEVKEKVVKTEYGFIMTAGERLYEVRGLAKRDNKLKATVKGINGEGSQKRMHVDTVDFTPPVQERTWLKVCAICSAQMKA